MHTNVHPQLLWCWKWCNLNITQLLLPHSPKYLRHPPLQSGHAAPNERPTLSNVALHRARQAAAAAAGSCARPQHPTLQRSASSGIRASAPLQPRLPAAPPSPPPGARLQCSCQTAISFHPARVLSLWGRIERTRGFS